MRKLIHFVHQSLDGCIEGPNGEFDWAVMDTELSAYSHALSERADMFAYGRVVWEMMSGYWPNVESISEDPHDLKFAPIWRAMPKAVFSNSLTEAGWNTRVISGDLAKSVAALKTEGDGDLLLMGGSKLATALTKLGLIDEYQVVVHPVVLGGGKPLFPSTGERVNLELVESQAFKGGLVLLKYVPKLY